MSPPPKLRKHLHTRSVTFRGYQCEGDLWDIEAEITDVKDYAHLMPDGSTLDPGTRVHDMLIRVTVDDSMTVRKIATSMASAPFAECQHSQDPMQKMIGCTMGRGWRQAIEKNLGGVNGCTHLRELLFNMATAAFQTIPAYREHQKRLAGQSAPRTGEPPYQMGKCMSWDFEGPVVARLEPEFYRWQSLKRAVNPE